MAATTNNGIRIGCVQNGDYGAAVRSLRAGNPETYHAQQVSVNAYERLVAGVPNVVVSLNAPAGVMTEGLARHVGTGPAPLPKRVPGRIRQWLLARKILAELRQFDVTHVLLRTADIVGCQVLIWCQKRRVPVSVILAARFDPTHPPARRFCQLANGPNVLLVGNHNRVATESMVTCGLDPAKAVAWDQEPAAKPGDFPVKSLPPADGPVPTLLYAGVVSEAKGVPDVVRAAERLHAAGRRFRLIVLGEGPARAAIAAYPGAAAGWIECPGVVPHPVVMRHMRDATLVVSPSHHSFSEGLPFLIYEGLANRAPVLMSDHPVFVRYFKDGVGIRFFPAGDDVALAKLVGDVLDDPMAYAELSRTTAQAWESFQIPTRFADLLVRTGQAWGVPSTRGDQPVAASQVGDGVDAGRQPGGL